MAELTWSSPKGKFSGAGKEISEALGRKPESTDLNERHPFDVEILRIPPGKAPYSYHSHSAQWEFYHVISGSGVVRHKDGTTPIEAGDAFIFKPGEPHQITNDTTEDMILYVVADNPIGDTSINPTAISGVCRSPSAGISAHSRWTILMVKNETVPRPRAASDGLDNADDHFRPREYQAPASGRKQTRRSNYIGQNSPDLLPEEQFLARECTSC
jgi:mannose-6-phosphate isomerase-like protein (cupin superfamily)